MVDGEFWFGIAYQGELVGYENLKPNIGGHVSFDALHYDTKMLADLESAGLAHRTDKDGKLAWTINYTAYEDLFGLPNGVSATTWSFGFKVIVVDNGDGTLTATVDYGGVEPSMPRSPVLRSSRLPRAWPRPTSRVSSPLP